jgi:hypothetical protein
VPVDLGVRDAARPRAYRRCAGASSSGSPRRHLKAAIGRECGPNGCETRVRDLDSPVVQGRDERRALNEAHFRDFNERVVEQVKDIAGEQAAFNIVCECSSLTCANRIAITPAEYELHHQDPRQFIVTPEHVEHETEDSVTRNDRFAVVRKRGEAGVIAEETAAD